MHTLLIALGSFAAYLVAYHTYGRWLARRVFRLDPQAVCPSEEVNDGRDYVPTPRAVVFGHHFTSIAGTGPIVGPAIAVFWGWLPALLWVLLGSIFIGAVHDLGALVVSLRSRGQTVGDVAARMIHPRARLLFLTVLALALAVVIGVFGLVIATIFATYPGTVFPIWVQIPIAVAVGYAVYRRRRAVLVPSLAALLLMYASIAVGAYWLPVDLTQLGLPPHGQAAQQAGWSPYANAVVVWTLVLLVYCYVASVLPVWTLLQPRDFINSNQLLIALGLLVAGLLLAAARGEPFSFVAPAVNPQPPADAPPIWPFLFITIACGAVSGFHCLVSSGTSSKQLRREPDAQLVGYGAMLLEGALAVIVILACAAALGRGVYDFDATLGRFVPHRTAAGLPATGAEAWERYYGGGSWAAMRLPQMIGGFVEGGANMLAQVGIDVTLGICLMAVLVACFAATTLDTATRLQRYVLSELGAAVGVAALRNRHVATTIAVGTGGLVALTWGPLGPGSGGLLLWPIFGATNQLLAGLSFLVIAFYLLRTGRPVWFLIGPMVIMLILPAWALLWQMHDWWLRGDLQGRLLVALGLVVILVELGMVLEAGRLWGRVRGVQPAPLPPLRRPASAAAGTGC